MEDPITSELYESPRVSLNQHLQRKTKETRARAGSIDRSQGPPRWTTGFRSRRRRPSGCSPAEMRRTSC